MQDVFGEGTQRLGIAGITGGSITFYWSGAQEGTSGTLWGDWNDKGVINDYVYLENLKSFKPIRIHRELKTVIILFTTEEWAVLTGTNDMPDPSEDPQIAPEQSSDPLQGEEQQIIDPTENTESGEGQQPTESTENTETGEQNGNDEKEEIKTGEEAQSFGVCAECDAVLSSDSAHEATCPKYAELPAESRVFGLLDGIKGMREKYNDRLVINDQGEEYFLTFNYLDGADYAEFVLWLNGQNVTYQEKKESEEIYRVTTEVGNMAFILSFTNVVGGDCNTINLRVFGTLIEE